MNIEIKIYAENKIMIKINLIITNRAFKDNVQMPMLTTL